MSRKRNNNDLYICVKRIKNALKIIFYVNLVLLILNFIISCNLIIAIQMIASLILILGNFINDFFIFPRAEQRNLERNMEDSFRISFGDDSIEGYYDNNFPPSLQKFIANSFENIFYTKRILNYSFAWICFRLIIYIIIFIVSIILIISLNVNNGLKIFFSIIQILFSGQYILGVVKSILYKYQIDTLYKTFLKEYKAESSRDYALLGYAIEYEVLKSSLKVMLDSKIYEEKKEDIEKDWVEEKELIFK